MRGIDPPHELALVEAQVIAWYACRSPGCQARPLPSHDAREPVEVRDDVAVDGLVEPEQSCLMGEQLAHGDRLLAGLGELGPVGRRRARRSRASRASGRAP